jgi:hypothetical protein
MTDRELRLTMYLIEHFVELETLRGDRVTAMMLQEFVSKRLEAILSYPAADRLNNITNTIQSNNLSVTGQLLDSDVIDKTIKQIIKTNFYGGFI